MDKKRNLEQNQIMKNTWVIKPDKNQDEILIEQKITLLLQNETFEDIMAAIAEASTANFNQYFERTNDSKVTSISSAIIVCRFCGSPQVANRFTFHITHSGGKNCDLHGPHRARLDVSGMNTKTGPGNIRLRRRTLIGTEEIIQRAITEIGVAGCVDQLRLIYKNWPERDLSCMGLGQKQFIKNVRDLDSWAVNTFVKVWTSPIAEIDWQVPLNKAVKMVVHKSNVISDEGGSEQPCKNKRDSKAGSKRSLLQESRNKSIKKDPQNTCVMIVIIRSTAQKAKNNHDQEKADKSIISCSENKDKKKTISMTEYELTMHILSATLGSNAIHHIGGGKSNMTQSPSNDQDDDDLITNFDNLSLTEGFLDGIQQGLLFTDKSLVPPMYFTKHRNDIATLRKLISYLKMNPYNRYHARVYINSLILDQYGFQDAVQYYIRANKAFNWSQQYPPGLLNITKSSSAWNVAQQLIWVMENMAGVPHTQSIPINNPTKGEEVGNIGIHGHPIEILGHCLKHCNLEVTLLNHQKMYTITCTGCKSTEKHSEGYTYQIDRTVYGNWSGDLLSSTTEYEQTCKKCKNKNHIVVETYTARGDDRMIILSKPIDDQKTINSNWPPIQFEYMGMKFSRIASVIYTGTDIQIGHWKLYTELPGMGGEKLIYDDLCLPNPQSLGSGNESLSDVLKALSINGCNNFVTSALYFRKEPNLDAAMDTTNIGSSSRVHNFEDTQETPVNQLDEQIVEMMTDKENAPQPKTDTCAYLNQIEQDITSSLGSMFEDESTESVVIHSSNVANDLLEKYMEIDMNYFHPELNCAGKWTDIASMVLDYDSTAEYKWTAHFIKTIKIRNGNYDKDVYKPLRRFLKIFFPDLKQKRQGSGFETWLNEGRVLTFMDFKPTTKCLVKFLHHQREIYTELVAFGIYDKGPQPIKVDVQFPRLIRDGAASKSNKQNKKAGGEQDPKIRKGATKSKQMPQGDNLTHSHLIAAQQRLQNKQNNIQKDLCSFYGRDNRDLISIDDQSQDDDSQQYEDDLSSMMCDSDVNGMKQCLQGINQDVLQEENERQHQTKLLSQKVGKISEQFGITVTQQGDYTLFDGMPSQFQNSHRNVSQLKSFSHLQEPVYQLSPQQQEIIRINATIISERMVQRFQQMQEGELIEEQEYEMVVQQIVEEVVEEQSVEEVNADIAMEQASQNDIQFEIDTAELDIQGNGPDISMCQESPHKTSSIGKEESKVESIVMIDSSRPNHEEKVKGFDTFLKRLTKSIARVIMLSNGNKLSFTFRGTELLPQSLKFEKTFIRKYGDEQNYVPRLKMSNDLMSSICDIRLPFKVLMPDGSERYLTYPGLTFGIITEEIQLMQANYQTSDIELKQSGCGICLEDFMLKDWFIKLPRVVARDGKENCGHLFHLRCISKWKVEKDGKGSSTLICPICVTKHNQIPGLTIVKDVLVNCVYASCKQLLTVGALKKFVTNSCNSSYHLSCLKEKVRAYKQSELVRMEDELKYDLLGETLYNKDGTEYDQWPGKRYSFYNDKKIEFDCDNSPWFSHKHSIQQCHCIYVPDNSKFMSGCTRLVKPKPCVNCLFKPIKEVQTRLADINLPDPLKCWNIIQRHGIHGPLFIFSNVSYFDQNEQQLVVFPMDGILNDVYTTVLASQQDDERDRDMTKQQDAMILKYVEAYTSLKQALTWTLTGVMDLRVQSSDQQDYLLGSLHERLNVPCYAAQSEIKPLTKQQSSRQFKEYNSGEDKLIDVYCKNFSHGEIWKRVDPIAQIESVKQNPAQINSLLQKRDADWIKQRTGQVAAIEGWYEFKMAATYDHVTLETVSTHLGIHTESTQHKKAVQEIVIARNKK